MVLGGWVMIGSWVAIGGCAAWLLAPDLVLTMLVVVREGWAVVSMWTERERGRDRERDGVHCCCRGEGDWAQPLLYS